MPTQIALKISRKNHLQTGNHRGKEKPACATVSETSSWKSSLTSCH
jgi:hypothetical protein